jgi:hypothetical protein
MALSDIATKGPQALQLPRRLDSLAYRSKRRRPRLICLRFRLWIWSPQGLSNKLAPVSRTKNIADGRRIVAVPVSDWIYTSPVRPIAHFVDCADSGLTSASAISAAGLRCSIARRARFGPGGRRLATKPDLERACPPPLTEYLATLVLGVRTMSWSRKTMPKRRAEACMS